MLYLSYSFLSSCLGEYQYSVLHLEYCRIEHGLCYQNLSCFASCLRLLRYTSLFHSTDHFPPNFIFCLLLGNLHHAALYVLYLIYSSFKLDHAGSSKSYNSAYLSSPNGGAAAICDDLLRASALLFSFPFLCITVKLKPANS